MDDDEDDADDEEKLKALNGDGRDGKGELSVESVDRMAWAFFLGITIDFRSDASAPN